MTDIAITPSTSPLTAGAPDAAGGDGTVIEELLRGEIARREPSAPTARQPRDVADAGPGPRTEDSSVGDLTSGGEDQVPDSDTDPDSPSVMAVAPVTAQHVATIAAAQAQLVVTTTVTVEAGSSAPAGPTVAAPVTADSAAVETAVPVAGPATTVAADGHVAAGLPAETFAASDEVPVEGASAGTADQTQAGPLREGDPAPTARPADEPAPRWALDDTAHDQPAPAQAGRATTGAPDAEGNGFELPAPAPAPAERPPAPTAAARVEAAAPAPPAAPAPVVSAAPAADSAAAERVATIVANQDGAPRVTNRLTLDLDGARVTAAVDTLDGRRVAVEASASIERTDPMWRHRVAAGLANRGLELSWSGSDTGAGHRGHHQRDDDGPATDGTRPPRPRTLTGTGRGLRL